MVDFVELSKTCEFKIGELSIKNKGSILKPSTYYMNMYSLLIEKFALKCQEREYIQHYKDEGLEAREWKWIAFKPLDSFARIRFDLSNNMYFIKAEKVAGIFKVAYTIELDWKKLWRNSSILSVFLPLYLRRFYWNRVLLPYYIRYNEELQAIKDLVKKELNVSVYD